MKIVGKLLEMFEKEHGNGERVIMYESIWKLFGSSYINVYKKITRKRAKKERHEIKENH